MGLRLRHTSLFLTYVLAPLCASSNFNYEQVNPRNSPATMLLHGRLSFRKPVLPSPSSGLVHRAFPIQFHSIQNSLFSTQHIVHTTMFFYTYDVLKMERAEDSAYVGSFPNIIIL